MLDPPDATFLPTAPERRSSFTTSTISETSGLKARPERRWTATKVVRHGKVADGRLGVVQLSN